MQISDWWENTSSTDLNMTSPVFVYLRLQRYLVPECRYCVTVSAVPFAFAVSSTLDLHAEFIL